MAYGVKYFADYKAGQEVRTVQLLLDGYAGPATEWFCSLAAPKESQGDSDGLFEEIIVSRVMNLEFMFKENYDLTEFVAEPRTYKCIILEAGEVKFEGYLEPYETSRAYRKPYYYVQMTATCGLNRLKKNIFQQVEYNEGNLMLNYFEILNRCLDTVGIERNRRIGIHTYMHTNPTAPNPLISVEVDVFRYFKDGIWMDCQSVITDILIRFNAQLYVENNTYVIRSSADHVLGFTSYAGYSPDGTPTGIVADWPGLIRDINYENTGDPLGEANTMDGGEVSLQPRVRRYTIEADMGGKKDTFNNGGLQLWTVDGPVGWEGNMPKALGGFGWTQVETGIVGAPYAMHIRGKAPQPYYTTRKKGVWPFRKTVKTPKEPEIWWESQKIEYNYKEVDSINVGFEYYTDDNSAGFLYAIAFFAQDVATGKISMSYVNPTNAGVRLESDYQLLVAPPHPRVNPATGITQSKGVIEHTIDMSNAYATKEIKTWCRVWFYYTADEPGKTGDEYWIYKIIGDVGAAPEFQVPEGDSHYRSTLESDPYESDEGALISVITGDYSAGFLGTTLKMGAMSLVPTGGWTRRGRAESISIYRACMADRLAFTYHVPDVIEAEIWIMEGEDITYSTILRFKDRSTTRLYKIVRLEFEHYQRRANVLAVEMTYVEPPNLKQRSYTDARGLLDESEGGDVVYPGSGNITGRIGIDGPEDAIEELQEEEITPEEIANGRTGVFEDVPPLIYTVKERSTAAVHLLDYLSAAYLETEQDEEDLTEDEKHDPEDFTLAVVSMPTWVESVEIDKLSVYVTAKPTVVGEFSLTLSVIDDAFGTIPNVVVPIIVYPPIKITYTLRDTSGLDPVDVAEIFNGAGFNKPEFDFDIKVTIDGHHEGWYGKLTTPDDVIMGTIDPYSLVIGTDIGTYIIGENVPAEIGFYQIDLGVYRDEGEEDNLRRVKFERIKFSFYDEETLSKAKFYLWGAESNALIGPIKPDGSSVFENVKEAWDVKIDIDGVLHDAGTSVLGSEIGDLDTKEIIIPDAVEDATYFQFGKPRPEFDPSTYNILLKLTLADVLTGDPEVVYIRAISFTINHKPIQPTAGVLELGSIPANTSNFDVIMELAATGNSIALPTDGWSVRNESESELFNSDEWVLYRYVGDELVNIDISAYTGNPQVNTYAATGITQVDSRLFGLLTSLQIGNPTIHRTPSTFRAINRRRMDGVVVGLYQSDFSFGPAVPIDDAPVGGPATGTGGVVLQSGLGIQIIKDDQYNTINVLSHPDQFDIDPIDRILKLKTNGVSLSHLAQIPSLSVIGNMSGVTATPTAVSVITSTTLAGASNTNLGSLLAIKTYIDNALTTVVSGTTNFFAKFLTAATIGVGILSESGITVTANGGQFLSSVAHNVNPRGYGMADAAGISRWFVAKAGLESGANSGSDLVFARYNDAGQFLGFSMTMSRATGFMSLAGTLTIGGSGVVISTTSVTLNPNFNSDLLDGQHGVYYLDRANHTGTQLAATISDFAAAVRAVPLTGLVTTTSSPVLATDSILVAFGKLQAQINTHTSAIGTGTVGYLPYYNTTTTFANSLLSQAGINVTANGGQFVSSVAANVNPRGFVLQDDQARTRWTLAKANLEPADNSGSDFVLGRYNDAGQFLGYSMTVFRATGLLSLAGTLTVGGSGVVISTTSVTLNPNFNSDLLDGQHGVYYLDRANHTGTQLAATISDFAAAVRAVPLTGLVVSSGAIAATDTILQAFGKLQGQINAVSGSIGTGTVNYFPYYNTTTTLATSVLSQTSTTITAHGAFYIADIPANTNVRGISLQTGGLTRWNFGKAGLETGSDAGSDFTIWSYNDAGSFKTEILRISRATSLMTLNGTLTITGSGVVISTTSTTLNPNFNADLLDGQHGVYYLDRANHTGVQAISTITGLQAALDAKTGGPGTAGRIAKYIGVMTTGDSVMTEVGADIIVNGGQLLSDVAPNSNVRGFGYRASGVNRWNAGKAGLETGSNAGSDYTIWSYSDAGSFLREDLRVYRASGIWAFGGQLNAPGGNSSQWNTAYSWGNHAGLYVTGTGTSGRVTIWTSSTQIQAADQLFYAGGSFGAGLSPSERIHSVSNIRADGSFISMIGTGVKPIDVQSTTMCTNLNADMVDGLHASAFAAVVHTHVASNITDFTSATRAQISGTGAISYNSSTGVISYTGSAGLTGSGTSGYAAFWSGTSSLTTSTVTDNGAEINFSSARTFGVEGPAAMRNYLHVHGYQANGTASNHGTLILHNLVSATINGAAALEILSTTRGFLNARMTRAQRLAMTPTNGLQVYQTDTVGASISGLKLYDGGAWYHLMGDTTYA